MSKHGKRFDDSRRAGRSGRVRVYPMRRFWQEREQGQVRWPLHKILLYTREIYPVKE